MMMIIIIIIIIICFKNVWEINGRHLLRAL